MRTLTNDALVPAFVTKVHRHARQLDLPDASVEIVFDDGTIEAGARQEVLSEIELELKSGNAGALFDLGTQLLDAAPLQVGTRSKAERGYALASCSMLSGRMISLHFILPSARWPAGKPAIRW